MPSVGPFELTEEEFLGLKILWQEDEKKLSSKNVDAGSFGNLMVAKPGDSAEVPMVIPPAQSSVLCHCQPNPRLRNGIDQETAESGETAEVEAESALFERNMELLASSKGRFV
ncbi:MAG TPA: hypothetical protein VF906_05885 [Candidatus Bathyarchaeia archaeon]